MKLRAFVRLSLIPLCVLFTTLPGVVSLHAQTAGGIAPISLMPASESQLSTETQGGQPTSILSKEGINVTIAPGPALYPSITVKPAQGKSWDLSPFGRIDAMITNTGSKPLSLGLRVDNAGDWRQSPWNTAGITIQPGATQTVKVYFGYTDGKAAFKLNSAAVTELLFLTGKVTKPITFRINEIWASGSAGEKPPADPNSVRIKPENGVIFAPAVLPFDSAKQIVTTGGAQASMDTVAKALQIQFAGGKKDESVAIKPAAGAWSLIDYNEIRLKVKNTGAEPVTPGIRLIGGVDLDIMAKAPIAPGATAEIAASFTDYPPWKGVETAPGKIEPAPGTGTKFTSGNTRSIAIFSDGTPGAKNLEVSSITADAPAAEMPAWLGQRPPVDGDWVKTLDENFDGNTINLKTWNTFGDNGWDKRTHFTKDDVIVKDGKVFFHYEKKTGFANDDPKGKQTDYACGFANSYAKWTQRYGYFEARMKLPKAPGLWPAFWLMPDRGTPDDPQWKRGATENGGMEFDIMEFLSGWGVYRYNIACHWDGYGKSHKATGSPWNYVQADKDGYITSGLLWTPGLAVFYCNGKELLRWENPRICSVPCYIIFDVVSGGWDNVPIDDTKLPDDWIVDYVRVWQRKDLASPADGPKPNNGTEKD